MLQRFETLYPKENPHTYYSGVWNAQQLMRTKCVGVKSMIAHMHLHTTNDSSIIIYLV